MAQLFTMPQLGSTMEEGTILKWRKREGEPVKKGEILLEVMTDKAAMEVEAPSEGVLRKVLAPVDATVPILQPIAILGSAEEPIADLLAQAGGGAPVSPAGNGGATRTDSPMSSAAGSEVSPAAHASHETRLPSAMILGAGSGTTAPASGGRIAISPRARRYADEQGVPVAALAGRGTGPNGRVLEHDVVAYLEERKTQDARAETEAATLRATPLAARMAEDLGIDLSDLATGLPGSRVRSEDVRRYAEVRRPTFASIEPAAEEDVRVEPFGGMRRRIAENVSKSAFTAPHVTLTLEVDMTAAADLRVRLLPEIEKVYGVRLAYNDILVKACARALEEHPRLNAALLGDEIHLYAHKNIGVAVALEEGLIVPVIRHVERKSLGTIAAESSALIARARSGKFTPDDLAGGTFSISNLGAFGIDVFDPIINPPQAAILGVGRIAEKPVVVDSALTVRTMMNLSLSFDHRLNDGAPAARFLQRLKELLENPVAMLI